MSNQIKAWQTRSETWGGEVDAELDTADHEPILGSVAIGEHISQEGWADGEHDDREGDEHDGREPDNDGEDGADKEPSFGWSDEEAARGRYPSLMGALIDREG